MDIRPDLIAREITNGQTFLLFLSLAGFLTIFAFRTWRREGWTVLVEFAAMAAGIFWCAIVMRGWIWRLLYQSNHGYEVTARDDLWASIVSTVGLFAIILRVIFLATERREGQSWASLHGPWIWTGLAAGIIPIALHLFG